MTQAVSQQPFGASTDAGGGIGDDQATDSWRSVLGSLARRAQQAALGAELSVPLASSSAEGSRAAVSSGEEADVEMGEQEPRWAAWAKQAAKRVKQQAAVASEGLSQGLEKAKSVDWAEQAKEVQLNVSRSLQQVTENATSATGLLQERVAHGVERAKSSDWGEHAAALRSNASSSFDAVSASLQERGQVAKEVARDYSGKSLHALTESDVLKSAKENASAAASTARGALSVASDRVSGVAALAMSPMKLVQFGGVFFLGLTFIMLSFNFLPVMLLAPQQFALLFTIGSVTMMSSFVVLKGVRGLASELLRRERLPFSCAYVIGLFGTLYSTMVLRSYILTTIFSLLQAVALLYFMASYLPGGRTALNMCFSAGARSARSLVQS